MIHVKFPAGGSLCARFPVELVKPSQPSSQPSTDLPKVPLPDVLQNAGAVGYLLEFLSQHQSADFLNFWLAVEAFRTIDLSTATTEVLRRDLVPLLNT